MGYESDSDYMLSTKLAKNRENTISFLLQTQDMLYPFLEEELKILLQEKRLEHPELEENGETVELKPWDYSYYQVQRQKREYKIEDEVIRQYFPFLIIKTKIFEIYQRIFSVKFVEDKSLHTYD
jgi:Zn-dependent oligopeptidase